MICIQRAVGAAQVTEFLDFPLISSQNSVPSVNSKDRLLWPDLLWHRSKTVLTGMTGLWLSSQLEAQTLSSVGHGDEGWMSMAGGWREQKRKGKRGDVTVELRMTGWWEKQETGVKTTCITGLSHLQKCLWSTPFKKKKTEGLRMTNVYPKILWLDRGLRGCRIPDGKQAGDRQTERGRMRR